ncbi:DNase I-like protein [Lentinus brumalis]|uniref:DNase I-like protein n=1 Tax=Lentinus brumalis TaxID=2498619 RepID=A0A371DAL5_9APHY|nr:DNase I-like protein [Polyporus brumalis]
MRGYGASRSGGVSDKWNQINQLIRDERVAILAIQETHLTAERVEALNDLFNATMHVVAGLDDVNQTGARGVAFAINKRLVNTDEAEATTVKPGRALLLKIPWTRGKALKLLNVYAPNDPTDNAAYWTSLTTDMLSRRALKPDILLGDFNLVEDSLDRLPPRRDPQEAVEALQDFCRTIAVTDGWRQREPATRCYTFCQLSTGSQSRIDRIYTTASISEAANDWETTGPGIPTDHRLVSLSVTNRQAPHLGKGRWSIPPVLLTDKIFIETAHALGMALQDALANMTARTQSVNPQTAYSRFKTDLLAKARSRAKQCIPKLDSLIQALKKDIHDMVNRDGDRTDVQRNHLAILQERLLELELRRFGRKRAVVAVNDWVQGETISKYWSRLNATPQPSTREPQRETHHPRS